MFGLTFLTASFAIAGAIGASIPLILHLLNRERARQLIFSTVRFIQMSHQTNVRRHKLKRLLLLLMRILMLALLGLAFARPFFADSFVVTQKTGGKRNAVIILDTSYSMQYEAVFENAKKEVGKILDGLDAADAACLILSSDNARVVAPLGSEFSHIRTALNTAKTTNDRTDYLDALQSANEILAGIPIGEKQVYLISDMQKRGWENFIETDKLSADVQIHFVDVHAEKPQNLAITGVNVPPVVLKEQKAARLVARVRNFGVEPVEDLPVRLFIDGNAIDTVELDIEPDDLADAVFSVEFQDEATHTGWVELSEDPLLVDNKRYFTLQSLQSIKVHAVRERERSGSRYQSDETFFIKKALASGGNPATRVNFTETFSLPNAATLERLDVLILADVAELSTSEAERVKNFVANGGGLIVTVGDNIETDTYKQRLGGEDGLMPCDFVQAVGDAFNRDQFRVIATVQYDHPIFIPFKEPNHGDFGKARFYRLFQAVPTKDATVIASYDDGSPALFEKPYGNLGRVLCFTSTIDREWNDLPIRAVYLPFLHESIKYLALKNVDTTPDYRIGDSVELKVFDDEEVAWTENIDDNVIEQRKPDIFGPTAKRPEIAIFDPNNVETRVQPDENPAEGSSQNTVFYPDTSVPGIYSAHISGGDTQYFVVNIDTSESDLAARDIEELTSMLKGTADESVEEKPSTELVAQYREDVEENQNVWVYLMLVVFALAVTEMFLANRV